jgi:hypothetical protein
LITFKTTGWITVELNKKVDNDLEKTPLEIKTDSPIAAESKEYVKVQFYDGQEKAAGRVNLWFSYPMMYKLKSCKAAYIDLPLNLPAAVNKIWRITKLPGPRITVHSNGVRVVNFLMSECAYQRDVSDDDWGRDAV